MKNGEIIVQMRGVCKRFGRMQALDNIDLEIATGTIIGLLGANGAGKSTLLRHIIGLYLADEGECVTFGERAAKLGPGELGRIGYVHQEGGLIDWMTVGQLLRYVSAHYETWNGDLEEQYIKEFSVQREKKISSMSPGQKQQVAILIAIAFEPELLILDEPASALDPIARSQFLDLLLQIIQDEGRTIIISSHILSDIEKIIDHVLIMDEGRLIRDCSFDSLRQEYARVKLTSLNEGIEDFLDIDNIVECQRNNREAVLIIQNPNRKELEEKGRRLNCSVDIKPLTLEDIYKIIASKGEGV